MAAVTHGSPFPTEDIDITHAATGSTGYGDLRHDAAGIPLYGVVVTIASLADVIRSKQAAKRHKDQRVLPTLRDLLDRRDAD